MTTTQSLTNDIEPSRNLKYGHKYDFTNPNLDIQTHIQSPSQFREGAILTYNQPL
jgi:hypothetical protein